MENTDDWQNSRQQSLLRVCVCVLFTLGSHTDTIKMTTNPSSDMNPLATLEGREKKKKHEINLISRRLKSVSDELYVKSQIVLFFIYVEGERKHAAD